jgi:hypothetical protein
MLGKEMKKNSIQSPIMIHYAFSNRCGPFKILQFQPYQLQHDKPNIYIYFEL